MYEVFYDIFMYIKERMIKFDETHIFYVIIFVLMAILLVLLFIKGISVTLKNIIRLFIVILLGMFMLSRLFNIF